MHYKYSLDNNGTEILMSSKHISREPRFFNQGNLFTEMEPEMKTERLFQVERRELQMNKTVKTKKATTTKGYKVPT